MCAHPPRRVANAPPPSKEFASTTTKETIWRGWALGRMPTGTEHVRIGCALGCNDLFVETGVLVQMDDGTKCYHEGDFYSRWTWVNFTCAATTSPTFTVVRRWFQCDVTLNMNVVCGK